MQVLSLSQVTTILAFFSMTAASNPAPAGAMGANGDYQTRERTPVFFGSEKEAMQSREFKKCSFSNTCVLIRNGYDSNLAVWGEITVLGITQFVNSVDSSRNLNPQTWLLKGHEVALISNLANGQHYSGAFRVFPMCGVARCPHRENTITKTEWTVGNGHRAGKKWAFANQSLVDGYNVGVSLRFNKKESLTVYIPPNDIQKICPAGHGIGSGEHMACEADCTYAFRVAPETPVHHSTCCIGAWGRKNQGGNDNCQPSSKWLMPFAQQAYTWPWDDRSFTAFHIDRVVKIEYGPQDIRDLKPMSGGYYQH